MAETLRLLLGRALRRRWQAQATTARAATTHERERREDCEVSRGLGRSIGRLPFWSPPLVLAIRVIYAFLGVSRRRHVAVPKTVREDAARLRGDILIAGRRIELWLLKRREHSPYPTRRP
jgi:hypothetical protein